jgi:zinc transporter ZupT
MGALGILINSGFSARTAVLTNILLNCTAFIGVLIGLIVGELNKVFTVYLTLIIAGNFLYISLTLMIP